MHPDQVVTNRLSPALGKRQVRFRRSIGIGVPGYLDANIGVSVNEAHRFIY
jgi:hypothetical protein